MRKNQFKNKQFLRIYKKGFIDVSLEQTIGLVLAVGFILLSVAFIMNLMNNFAGKPDQGSEASFDRLGAAINTLFAKSLEDPTKVYACKIQNGYIKPNFAIAGFNKDGEKNVAGQTGTKGNEDWGYIEETCGKDDKVYKPSDCLGFACICLCNGGSGDITGNNCKEKAKCSRLPASIKTIYSEQDGAIIDAVFYSEKCNFKGSDKKVISGYYLELSTSSALKINEILTNDEYVGEKYKNFGLCDELLTQPEPAKEEKAADNAGAGLQEQ